MRAGDPVHDFGAGHGDAQRHTGSDAFGHANHVRFDPGVLDCPPLAGARDAALDFVHHKKNSMTVANAPQFLHEDGRSDYVSAFALDRLDEDRGYLLWREGGLEHLLFQEARAAEREGIGFLLAAAASAVHIGIANMRHAGDERSEAAMLLRLRSGE